MAATLAFAAARRIRVVASTCKACRHVAWTYPQVSYRSFHAVPIAYAPPPPDHPAFGAGIATSLRNAYLATTSAVAALLDPERGDMVATLGEATGELALQNMLDQMKADAGGRAILRDRPRIRQDTIDVDTLRLLPHDTLGFAYAKFLDTHGFNPNDRATVRYIEDEELAYVMQRYREVHDFWHVLSGLPPTVVGEIALKWFEMMQTGLPVTALSAFVGPLRLTREQRRDLFTVYVPWASHAGPYAKCLLTVRYEDLLEVPLVSVRAMLQFEPAPTLPREKQLQLHEQG